MSQHEVPEPIVNSPFEEPKRHWHIQELEPAELREGRRPAMYFYRRPGEQAAEDNAESGIAIELKLVNRIRKALGQWRPLALRGEGGVSGTSMELMRYWRRDGRDKPLFFAQLEAAETIIFLNEARRDFLQGIDIPTDEPSDDRKADGFRAFRRLACKMATGSGKTTVMAMVAAWSILNKVADRSNARYSDVVLVVCPNVTIRNRLRELDPELGEASLYRKRDLVPASLMSQLTRGRVLVINWHHFEPRTMQVAGTGAKVTRAGRAMRVKETIHIGKTTTTARGIRYLTPADYRTQVAAELLEPLKEIRDRAGNLTKVEVRLTRYVESDTAVVERVLGREVGGKRNILVMNDEAHHAYRLRRSGPDPDETEIFGDDEDGEAFFKEATVWVDGLDRIHKLRGVNFCLDLSATPYYLGRAGADTNRIFPWVVSEFGLVDAIESGLTKIPQLAVRDTSGATIPGYFNIWRWIMPKLTAAERGGKKGIAKPEAVLKYANTPVAMMAGLWEELRLAWHDNEDEDRPPVFIIVCKNTKLAKVVFEWLAEDRPPVGIPSAGMESLLNKNGAINTIRVDSKVIQESDSDQAKSAEVAWMRHTLDTVGKRAWPTDRQARPIYPDGFEELAAKLQKPLHPPGRDVRCIVSVGMLTEGWDCNTVTHIVGLRPFMSQLLCEQVVGRGLRRAVFEAYELDNGEQRLSEEVATVLGVPFEIVPFKQSPTGNKHKPPRTWRIHALPDKEAYAIRFPRVEGYVRSIRSRVTVDWDAIGSLKLDPKAIPPEIEMKAGLPSNAGRPSLFGPGKLSDVTLNPYRRGHRLQERCFDLARALTVDYLKQPGCRAPAHVLFPQLLRIVQTYLRSKIAVKPPAQLIDVFLSPYYGWMIDFLVQQIHPDDESGEEPELPRYEPNRGPGSTADVDFRTRREPYPVIKSHINAVVPDTKQWEQSAAYRLDKHPRVQAFVKNAGLGFSIPYEIDGEGHDFVPDFIVRLTDEQERHVIVETKGFDKKLAAKTQAAARWVAAVNHDGTLGHWEFLLVTDPNELDAQIAGL